MHATYRQSTFIPDSQLCIMENYSRESTSNTQLAGITVNVLVTPGPIESVGSNE